MIVEPGILQVANHRKSPVPFGSFLFLNGAFPCGSVLCGSRFLALLGFCGSWFSAVLYRLGDGAGVRDFDEDRQ